jgi:hypothetical protein
MWAVQVGEAIKIRSSPGRQTSGSGENWGELRDVFPLLVPVFSVDRRVGTHQMRAHPDLQKHQRSSAVWVRYGVSAGAAGSEDLCLRRWCTDLFISSKDYVRRPAVSCSSVIHRMRSTKSGLRFAIC